MIEAYIAVIDAGYSAYDFEKHVFEQQGYRFDVFSGEPQDLEGKLLFANGEVGLGRGKAHAGRRSLSGTAVHLLARRDVRMDGGAVQRRTRRR